MDSSTFHSSFGAGAMHERVLPARPKVNY